jgi:ABC-2 type transport system permease protein
LEEKQTMLLLLEDETSEEWAWEVFASAFADYNVEISNEDIAAVKEKIASGEVECAFSLDNLTSYTYYVNNLSMYDDNTYVADEVLQNIYRIHTMTESGIPGDEAQQILSTEITHTTENLGKDQIKNYFYTYIMIFALYMVIMLYGQMVATNVATEKSSRAMEVLITSAKPTAMMFGKVIASCLAGLIQLICIFGSAFLFFQINKVDWGDNMVINSIFNMPISLLLYMFLFFVLGFFIYAFLYGAVGSTASKLEDINTSVMPITMLFVVAFCVVMFSMSSSNVDNTIMVVCSYIPFTSPMAMFTRIAMSTVPVYEIVISIVILIGSVIGIGVLSAKIYRVGVLLYGTTPKMSSILKSLWKA